nr:LuxR family transcriptional regulator [Nakamurella aerolata]
MVHRRRALNAAEQAIQAWRHGAAAAAVVTGDRGMGRSSLLAAVGAALAGEPGQVLQARAAEAERELPLAVLAQLIPSDDPRWEPALLALEQLSAAGASALGRRRCWESVVGALREVLRAGPVAMVLDDAECADAESLAVLAQLRRRLTDLPLLLVLAVRSAPTSDAAGRARLAELLDSAPATMIELEPLCLGCTTAAAEAALGAPIDPELALVCHLVSDGNPLVANAFLRRLTTGSGAAPGADEVRRIAAQTLESTRMTWLRSDRPAAAELLSAMAVLGPQADPVTTSMMVGQGELAAAQARQQLADAGFVDLGLPVAIRSELLRGAVLAGIPLAERQRLHLAAAELLSKFGAPATDVAEHLMVIEPTGLDWAVTALQQAARTAAGGGDYDAASRYLRRAIAESAELPDSDPVGRLTEEIGAVELHHDLPSSMRHAERIAQAVADPAERATALLPLVSTVLAIDSIPATAPFTALAAELVGTGAALPQQWCRFGAVAVLTGADAGPRWRRVAAHGGPGPAAAAVLAAWSAALAGAGTARRTAKRLATAALGELPPGVDQLPALLTLLWTDESQRALTGADAVVLAAQSQGAPVEEATARLVRAELLRRRGELTDSLADAQAARDLAVAAHAGGIAQGATAVLVLALLESGQAALAREALARVDPLARPHPLVAGYLRFAAGQEALGRGAAQRAAQYFLQAGHALSAAGIHNPACLPWQSAAAAAQLAAQDRAGATRSAQAAMSAARRWGGAGAMAPALAAAAMVGLGNRSELLQRAADAAAAAELRLDLRPAVAAAAATATADGDVAEAKAVTALGAVLTGGSVPDAAPGQQGRAAGSAQLTASETRVTDLVIKGMSNQEVADALCLSRRTVDTHLNRVYRKLKITSRSALAAALGRKG